MKISCDIIRDILPLYAEDMVSDATKELVDDHLCQCDACTKELGVLKKAEKVPAQVEVNSLKRVGDSIRRRRVLAVLTAIFTIISIFVSIVTYLRAPIFLTAQEAIAYTQNRAVGDVKIVWTDEVAAHAGFGTEQNYAHVAYTSRWRYLYSRFQYGFYGDTTEHVSYIKDAMLSKSDRFVEIADVFESTGSDLERNHWYVNIIDGTADMLLWDAGKSVPVKPIMETSYLMISIYAISVIMIIVFLYCAKIVHKSWLKTLFFRFSILAGGVFIAVFLATGGQITLLACQYNLFDTIQNAGRVSIPLVLTGLLYHQLYQLHKKDKGL